MARYAFIVGLFHSQLFTVLQRIADTTEAEVVIVVRRVVVVAIGRAEVVVVVVEAAAAFDPV